jgi:type I restriction enzyme R subunit
MESVYEVEDEVSSDWIVRDAAGNEYKPEDYLAAFARFVKENPADIEAIEILLKQPERWNPHALQELREKLNATAQRFTDENLQKAYKLRYNKALVDIISMIKNAAHEQDQLFTAEERVTNAMAKVTAGKDFTEEQKIWLERIREHLIVNLSIDMEDFEVMPIFSDFGGWGKANHIFGHRLIEILKDLNQAIAS